MIANKYRKEKIMTLIETFQEDSQRHLYVKSAITSGATQYHSEKKWTWSNQTNLLNKPNPFVKLIKI